MLLMWIRKSTKIWWKEIKGFLSGGHTEIQDRLQEKWLMQLRMEFEKAAEFRDQIKAIETVMTRQNDECRFN